MHGSENIIQEIEVFPLLLEFNEQRLYLVKGFFGLGNKLLYYFFHFIHESSPVRPL